MKSPIAWIPLASGMLVLVLSLGLALMTTFNRQSVQNQSASQNTSASAKEADAMISLSPENGNYDFSTTATYPVGILVDSAGKSIDGVDTIVNFDPTKVQVVGKVNPTTVFSEVPLNTVDNVKGRIRFSALTFDPKPVTGVIGTFSFKAVSKGEANFTFEFVKGATTDSNMAEHGTAVDVLSKVGNATYTFK